MDRLDFDGLFDAPVAGFGPPGGLVVPHEIDVTTPPSESLSADKYAMTVIKTREVVDINESYRAESRPEVRSRLMHSIDRLLGFLISQYRTPVSVDDVRHVMNGPGVSILSANELRGLPDGLIPVAIMRELLAKHRIVFDPKVIPNWTTFSQRYMSLVLHV